MTRELPERTRATLILPLAWTSVAVAGWLLPASIHIVGWNGDTPELIALLPSPTWLALFVALSGGAAVTVARVLPPATDRRVARVCAPLTLLLLWAVPYLPAIGGWAPMLLVLAGPVRWAIAAVAIVGCGNRRRRGGTASGSHLVSSSARTTRRVRRKPRHFSWADSSRQECSGPGWR